MLESVGFDAAAIGMFYVNNPRNEEEAVQMGLLEWARGETNQPTTWKVLIAAMEHAKLAKQDTEALKRELHERSKCALCVHGCACFT